MRAISQPSGAVDCRFGIYEIEIFAYRGRERQSTATQTGGEIFQIRTHSRGRKAIAEGAAWISLQNQAVPLFAGAVPSRIWPQPRPATQLTAWIARRTRQ